MHVREATEEYLASQKRLRPKTKRGYEQRLAVFSAWCQSIGIELEQVRYQHVDSFVDWLRTTRTSHKSNEPAISTYTLQGYVTVILTFLHWCVEDEEYAAFVNQAIVQKIKKPKIEVKVIETFTKEQLNALFAACDRNYNGHLAARDRTMLALLIDTGIRASELCDLTIGNCHLDPKDAFIRVHGKGDKWREVGLGDRSRRGLRTYIRSFRFEADKSEQVFLNRANNKEKYLSSGGLLQVIKRLGRWGNIQGVRCSPHTFRHTFACAYLLQGGDVYSLQRLLGHTSIQTTECYVKAINATQARSLQGKSVLDQLS